MNSWSVFGTSGAGMEANSKRGISRQRISGLGGVEGGENFRDVNELRRVGKDTGGLSPSRQILKIL